MSFFGIISQADLDEFLTDLTFCIAQLTNTIRLDRNRGHQCDCEMQQLQWLIRCRKSIQSWEQNSDGLSGGYTNWITQDQLNALISSCKNTCGCTRAVIPEDEEIPTIFVLPFSTNTPDYIAV